MTPRTVRVKKKRSLKERRRRAKFFLAGLMGAGVLLLLIGSVVGLHRSEVSISEVNVFGANLAQESLIQTVIGEMLSGSYFFVIPRKNIFLFPQSGIEERIEETFYPVKSVVVERKGFTGINVFITERIPDALWCQTQEEHDACYYIDETGFVFAPEKGETAPQLRFEGGGVSKPFGETYLPGTYRTLQDFLKNMEATISQTPVRIVVDEHNDVSVFFEKGGEVRFTVRDMGEALLQNIASVFASKRFSNGEAFEYVDFRFGNKVYVKFVGH